MYTVTLLTNPETPALQPAAADALRNAWGGGDIQWLAADEACAFNIAEIPENRWQVW